VRSSFLSSSLRESGLPLIAFAKDFELLLLLNAVPLLVGCVLLRLQLLLLLLAGRVLLLLLLLLLRRLLVLFVCVVLRLLLLVRRAVLRLA
jgi:hypothetical protein